MTVEKREKIITEYLKYLEETYPWMKILDDGEFMCKMHISVSTFVYSDLDMSTLDEMQSADINRRCAKRL